MLPQFSLEGMHVVVIGASAGLGAETSIQCAAAGAKVSICARREDRLQQLADKLPGHDHGYGVLDVENFENMGDVFDSFVQIRGPIGGLVYAVGLATLIPVTMTTPERFLNTLKINLVGALTCTREAINAKRVNKNGCSVVWISSVASTKPGGAGTFAYSASKAGMVGGMRALAVELARRNIRVNAVSPGVIKTENWNQNQLSDEQQQANFNKQILGMGEPSDIANACIYLLSPAAKWITGQDIYVDGGYSLG